jgi:hypothetical protein
MPKKVITPAKKVAPKKVAKKAVVKKSTAVTKKSKAQTKKELVYADSAHSFWLHDGQILNSLKALESALGAMETEVFGHHVQAGKHDFADWVDSVLCDGTCAADLRKTKTPKAAQTVVVKHLKVYNI